MKLSRTLLLVILLSLAPLALRAQVTGAGDGHAAAAHASGTHTIIDEVPIDTLAKYGLYDEDRLAPSFHKGRRSLVLDSMAAGSVALFQAAPDRTRANDIDYLYHQDPNFYYLTGCLESGSALILSKEPIDLHGRSVHEILFVAPRNPAQETWTGRRLGPDGAMNVLHMEAALPIDSLEPVLARLLPSMRTFYDASKVHKHGERAAATASPVFTDTTLTRLFRERATALAPQREITRALSALREIKTPEELALMRRTIAISNDAHNRVIHEARPGWHEYELQALAEYTFTKNGAEYDAYPCIVGSGPNSTILHYETNRRQTRDGEFIEMDMGAEYHGYSADITRSFPINGTFTTEQKAIYELVLAAQDSGIKACVTGAPFRAAHQAAVRVITSGLLRLGIITDSADYRKYFMHGTSHYLGLDVHDAGTGGPLRPGVVMTVEPGIYIAEGSPCDKKWWNIGCRIEDDILVTDHGPENLSAASPRTIPELEKLLAR